MRLAVLLALLVAGKSATAQHFDVELRTDKGPVAGSRILTDFFGDMDLAGKLPFDGLTGYRIFPAYFGDFAGGRFATANPGFQAFAGTFVQSEEIHFRALGTLQYWSPSTGKWGPAPAGVKITLFGGIPPEVVLGYSTNPSAWAEQYAYYQAGTRFETDRISGPLSALIDDVKAGGSFHSHLDWKISGSPPVGAYMVTLELWSPTLIDGRPKYQASQPLQIIFESGITNAQMNQAFDVRISPPCEAARLSWSVGSAACAANAAGVLHGLAVSLRDTEAPATGSASFSCLNGRWGSPSDASCSLPPPAACSAQSLSWRVGEQSCTSSAPATTSGSNVRLSDSVLPTLGEASFSCQDGSWGQPSAASCDVPPPAACSAQTLAWNVSGQACQAAVGQTASGLDVVASDTVLPATGSARFSCSNGVWSGASQASCALPPPSPCAAQTLHWAVGKNSCSASLASTPSGRLVSASDQVGPATGSADFSCSNGVWSAASNAQCTEPAPADCASQTLSWVIEGNRCQGQASKTASGSLLVAADVQVPLIGNASFSCSNGQWSEASKASCAAPPPSACAAQSAYWVQGAASCSAELAPANSGQSLVLTNRLAPNTGSASFSCTQGVWSAASNASCVAPAPKACAAELKQWTQGGQSCSATLAASESGGLAIATDKELPATGSARFACSKGSWSGPSDAICALPPAAPCAAQSLTWTQGKNSCSGQVALMDSSSTVMVTDVGLPSTGSASFSCNKGSWGTASQAVCSVPPPAACTTTTLSWRVGAELCQGKVAGMASGSQVQIADEGAPSKGLASFSCSEGQWSAASAASCKAPPATPLPRAQVPVSPWAPSSYLPWEKLRR